MVPGQYKNCLERGGTGSVWSRGWYWSVLDGTGCYFGNCNMYWVSIGQNWLELGGTESVWSRGWYWCWPHGQKKAVLVVSRLYSVSTGRYWFVLGDTGSV